MKVLEPVVAMVAMPVVFLTSTWPELLTVPFGIDTVMVCPDALVVTPLPPAMVSVCVLRLTVPVPVVPAVLSVVAMPVSPEPSPVNEPVNEPVNGVVNVLN